MLKRFIKGLQYFILISFLFTSVHAFEQSEKSYKIGVLSFNEKLDTFTKWSPLAEYLTVSLDKLTFEIVPLFYEELDQAVKHGQVDFILTNPGHFVELKAKYHLSGAMATLIEREEDTSQFEFGGVIFTRSDSGISSLKDLRKKSIGAVSKSSLGGFQAQAYELQKVSLNIDRDVTFVFTGMPHANAVLAVMNGEVEAGFVRTGILEKMAFAKEINLGDIKVLNSQKYTGFTDLISTDLYPEWPFAVAPHMDIDTSRAVASMLLMLRPDNKYAQSIGIHGFNVPSNYLKVEEMMRSLHLSPFDQRVSITFAMIWDRYQYYIIAVVFMVFALFVRLQFKTNSEKKIKIINDNLNKAMTELEDKNQTMKCLFENMHDGFALHEIILDENGKPVDYAFLDVNAAFTTITGLSYESVVGKTVKQVLPQTEEDLIKRYADVAINNSTISFTNYSIALDKHFKVNVYSTAKNQFATIFTDNTLEVRAKEKITSEKNLLEIILEDTLSGYWDWNLKDQVEYLSPSFKRMLGYEVNEMENMPGAWQRIIFQEDLVRVTEQFHKHVKSKGAVPYYNEVRYFHKNGSTVHVIVSGRVIEWEGDTPVRMVGCHINITPIKELEQQLREERELFKTTLHSIGDGVISTDSQGNVDIMNAVAEKLTGWTNAEAKGLPFQTIFNTIYEFTGKSSDSPVDQVLKQKQSVEFDNNMILVRKNLEHVAIEESASPIKGENGEVNGVVVVFRDATEKKEKQERIRYLSYHDQLTGLYNRHFFEEEINRIDREVNLPLSVVMLDANGLKLINDAFGHEAGDSLLKNVSSTLISECRDGDIIARIGGDEFVLLLPKTSSEETKNIVERIYITMKSKTIKHIEGSVSIGWETKDRIEQDFRDVLSIAEDNMYRQKITESQSMRNKSIRVFMQTLYERNETEKKHSENVSRITEIIASQIGLHESMIKDAAIAGLMHDVGKIAMDNEILDKPGPLTIREYEEVKKHPEIGYQILKSADAYARLADYVLSHHERWDGKGYPRGLSGEEIPLIARIIAVADAYEAMTNERPFRKALSHEQALDELRRCSGTQFDSNVVIAYEKTFTLV